MALAFGWALVTVAALLALAAVDPPAVLPVLGTALFIVSIAAVAALFLGGNP